MGFISQVQPSQGNQSTNTTPSPINTFPSPVNYSPPQQQYGGGKLGNVGQKITYSPLSDQPTMGQPNPYPNTIGQWDNANIQPQPRRSGKGKGF